MGKVLVGDGDNPVLLCRMRAQANFVEYTPFVLILMALIELAGGPKPWLWAIGIVYVLARIAHAFGMDRRRMPNPMRAAGAATTWAILLGARAMGDLDCLARPRTGPLSLIATGPRRLAEARIGDEGVGAPLRAEGRGRAMAGDEGDVVAHRPQPGRDRVDQRRDDRPSENRCGRSIRGTARRRPSRIATARGGRRHGPACAPACGGRTSVSSPTVTVSPSSSQRSGSKLSLGICRLAAVIVEARDPEAIGLVRALDRHAELLRQHAGLSAMIDMAVGEQDLLDRHAMLRRRRFEPGQVAAGIDEGAAHRLGAPQQGAILLERR